MKPALVVLFFLAFAFSANGQTPLYPTPYTVSTLPAASSYKNRVFDVIDAVAPGDCTIGGGTYKTPCISDGSTWGPWGALGSGTGTVTDVHATSPLHSSGGSTPTITIDTASGSQAGALSSTDWNSFNSKQNAFGFTPENFANKDAVNGYAGLDSGGLLKRVEFPAAAVFTDQVNIYTAGMKQSFQANGTNAGSRWVGVSSDPSTLQAGDVWYNTTATHFKANNGATKTFMFADDNLPWSQITSTPTTLGGYGITDAYTKTASDAKYQLIGNYLVDCGSNGFLARTALNTTLCRTLTGTTNRLTITNTTGGGDPVFNVPDSAQLNIAKLLNLTTNGPVYVSGGDGTLNSEAQLSKARGGTGVDLSATGGTHQVLRQSSAAGAISVSQLACSDLSDSGVFCTRSEKTISVSGLGLSGGGDLSANRIVTLTSSANPGASQSILASDVNGYLQLLRLGIGTSPSQPLDVAGNVFIDAATANLYMKDTSTGFQASSTLVISPQANNCFRSTSFTSGLVGFNVCAAGSAEFDNVDIRGAIHAGIFTYNAINVTAGSQLITPSAAKLKSDVTVTASPTYGTTTFTVDVVDSDGITHAASQLFAVNDIIRLKDGLVGDTWFKVTAVSDQTTFWRYTASIQAGSNNVTYRAGQGIPDYGVSGKGGIILTADQANSPYLQMFTHAATFSSADASGSLNLTPQLRLGNLNGSYGYGADVYGFAAGQYGAASKSWITVEQTNGIRIGNNATQLAQWDTSGNILVGQQSASQSNIYLTAGGLYFRNNTTIRAQILSNGSGYFANNLFSFDTSGNVTIAGNAIIGGFSIGTDVLEDAASTFGLASTITGGDDVRFWAGSAYSARATAPFTVTKSGVVTATSGTISAWTLGTTRISSTNIFIDQAGQYLSGGSTPPTSYGSNVGFFLEGANSGRFSLYKDTNNYLQWDNSKLLIKAANFTLDSSGNLTATSATLSGAITATSGSITGTLTMSGPGSAIAIGTAPPVSCTSGTGIWIDRTAICGVLSGVTQAKFDATNGNISAGGGRVLLNSTAGVVVGHSSGSYDGVFGSDVVGEAVVKASAVYTNLAKVAFTSVTSDGSSWTSTLKFSLGSTDSSNLDMRVYVPGSPPTFGGGDAQYLGMTEQGVFKGFTVGANSAPNAMLDVRGVAEIAITNSGASARVLNLKSSGTATNTASYISFSESTTEVYRVEAKDKGGVIDLRFYGYNAGLASTPQVVFTGDGNVGIGTTSPSSQLELSSTVSGANQLIMNTTGTNGSYFEMRRNGAAYGYLGNALGMGSSGSPANTDTALYSNGKLILQGSSIGMFGNVGIGTASPATTLHVIGAGRFGSNTSLNVLVDINRVDAWNNGGASTLYLNYNGGSTIINGNGGNGVQVGTPTGGDKGAGTLNVGGDVYKNGTAYTNPDYVFEKWATGKIEKFADKEGALAYRGLMPLDELKTYVQSNYHLPGFGPDAGLGMFSGGDQLLKTVEEQYIRIFDLNDRIKTLEALVADLEKRRN